MGRIPTGTVSGYSQTYPWERMKIPRMAVGFTRTAAAAINLSRNNSVHGGGFLADVFSRISWKTISDPVVIADSGSVPESNCGGTKIPNLAKGWRPTGGVSESNMRDHVSSIII